MSNIMSSARRLIGRVLQTVTDGNNHRNGEDDNHDDINQTGSSSHRGDAKSIIQTAAILLRKLPGDLTPLILDHAEMWVPVAVARNDRAVVINEGAAGDVVLECEIPANMPANVARRVKITTTSRDQGWSSYPNDHGTYRGSWSWFEVGVVKARRLPDNRSALVVENGSEQGQGAHSRLWRKRVVTNVHASEEWKTHEVTWDFSSKDPEIREMIAQLEGGDVILLTIWARYPGWQNRMQSASIEVEGVYVRKV